MRYYRIIILSFLVGACKLKQANTTSAYYEDLSIFRLHSDTIPSAEKKSLSNQTPQANAQAIWTGHIKNELDSIIQISKQINKRGKVVNGYTIQIYSGSSREEAYRIKSEMQQLFPKMHLMISYHQPIFRVRTGRFTERLQASRTHQLIKKAYPQAMLLPQKVYLKYE